MLAISPVGGAALAFAAAGAGVLAFAIVRLWRTEAPELATVAAEAPATVTSDPPSPLERDPAMDAPPADEPPTTKEE